MQGTPSNERVVTLRREKRDVDLLVACDDECLPEDQIKDYDVLLQYDDVTEPSPGSFFRDFEREPCAYVCKIVGMNKTEGSNDVLDGEYTITSVEESPDESDFETSHFSHYPPLRTTVGTRKNVSFSSSTIENVTTSYELPNATSPCTCNNTNTTNEITTTTARPTDANVTENTTLNHPNSSTLLVLKEIQENSTVQSDFQSIVINETTTQQQQLFSVVPVIPKVIRFTVVEAEMAEAGVNTTLNSDKTQENNYKDIKNNVSLAFQSFLESLAPLESLGLGNIGLGNATNLVSQNLTLTPWSPKLSHIAQEEIISQTLPPQEPKITLPIMKTVHSDSTTKKSLIEEAFQLVSPISNGMLNSLQDDDSLTASNVIRNDSVIANFIGIATTTSTFMTTSPTADVSSTKNIEHLIPTELIVSNQSISDQNATSKLEDYSKLIGVLTTASPVEGSNATASSPSNGTISSNSSDILTFSTNITHPIGNVSKPTDINLHSSNQSLNNDSIVLETLNSNKENNTSTEDYKLSQSNTTHLTNQTKFKDDVGRETGNHTTVKLPLGFSEISSTLSSISDNIKKNVTI